MTYARKDDAGIWRDDYPPAIYHAPERDWDLRPMDSDLLASLGWLPITTAIRPDDTATTTNDRSLGSGDAPVESWTVRPKTPEELAADAAAQRQALVDVRMQALPDDIPAIQTTQDTIVTVLADALGVTL